MVVNKLRPRLDANEWQITVIDQSPDHYYQPGFLFIPFGDMKAEKAVKPTRAQITSGVNLIQAEIDKVAPDTATVYLTDGTQFQYDQLVIATGSTPRPDETEGMAGDQFRKSVHEFYSYEGTTALRDALAKFEGGRLVVHITEMPIKCPVAPLEFAFLADAHFRKREIRESVDITYVTPLDGAFTKPVAAAQLGSMLDERNIGLETDFMIERVDEGAIVSFDEREIPFDLLVTVPVNMGADFVQRSGIGNELNFIPVDKETFLATGHENIFAIGDAADLPTSKAGSVAHFSVDVFAENFVDHIAGKPMKERFDGHANCFVESGDGKGMLIDFNYDTEPLPGAFPVPKVGPFPLLRESRRNHWGKRAFEWLYWHMLLPGRPIPLPAKMSMAGKERPGPSAPAATPPTDAPKNTLEV
jgi:sulfide:quinone oxidoreductase